MAIIGMDSVSVVDLTDGIAVSMSPESYAFPAGVTNALEGSVQTTITAFAGTTQKAASVTVSSITAPAGISVVSDNHATSPTLTITIAASVTQPGVVLVPVVVGELTIVKRFAFSLAKTGSSGTSGTSPINVIMGNDSVTIPTNSAGNTVANSSITIPFAGYQGTSRIATTVALGALPSGITAGTNTAATTSADGSLVLNIANGSNLGGSSVGTITLTFTAGGSNYTKIFSWSKALAGTDGTGSAGTSPYNIIVGNEDITVPTNPAGATVSASSIAIPFAGYQGTERRAATVTVTGLPSGITVGTNTAATTSADGSLVLNVANGSTLGGANAGVINLSFVTGDQTFLRLFTWAKALAGSPGTDGADAIVMAITSSNGTVFKNTAIATTLTANVFKGGVQVTGTAMTDLGVLRWYKDGNTTSVGTGPTLVIDAGQVTNKATYVCQLENP